MSYTRSSRCHLSDEDLMRGFRVPRSVREAARIVGVEASTVETRLRRLKKARLVKESDETDNMGRTRWVRCESKV